jgi:hypothetical protein
LADAFFGLHGQAFLHGDFAWHCYRAARRWLATHLGALHRCLGTFRLIFLAIRDHGSRLSSFALTTTLLFALFWSDA